MSAVSTHGLSKRYSQGPTRPPVDALKEVTLEIPRGEIFSFLGPNGSGKTTLLKCLLNIIFPTAGTLSILDRPVTDIKVRRHIGYLPENPYFYDRFTGADLLRFYGGLYSMKASHLRERIPIVIDEVGLGSQAAARPLRTYSKGMLQRIGIAQAVLAEPELIILDEPSTGLDPIGRRQIKDLIRHYYTRGHTVFLNTHILEDVENLCHRVGVIYKGKLLEVATLEELTQAQDALQIRVRGWTQGASDAVADLTTGIESRPNNEVRLALMPGVEAPTVIRALVQAEVDIFTVAPVMISLEDRFLGIIGAEGGIPDVVQESLSGTSATQAVADAAGDSDIEELIR